MLYKVGDVVRIKDSGLINWAPNMADFKNRLVLITAINYSRGSFNFYGESSVYSYEIENIKWKVKSWKKDFMVFIDEDSSKYKAFAYLCKKYNIGMINKGLVNYSGDSSWYGRIGYIIYVKSSITSITFNTCLRLTVDQFKDLLEKEVPVAIESNISQDYNLFKENDFVVITSFEGNFNFKKHWFKKGEVLELGGKHWTGGIKNSFDIRSKIHITGNGVTYDFNPNNYTIRFATQEEIDNSFFKGGKAKLWCVKGDTKVHTDIMPRSHWFVPYYVRHTIGFYTSHYYTNKGSHSSIPYQTTLFSTKQLQTYINPIYGEKQEATNHKTKENGKETNEVRKEIIKSRDGRKVYRNPRAACVFTSTEGFIGSSVSTISKRSVNRGVTLSSRRKL